MSEMSTSSHAVTVDAELVCARAPVGLLAELTHRCPLQCPYCSNPLQMERVNTELSSEEWQRVMREAGALGILQVHLSGGEPTVRPDLEDIVRAAVDAGLYTNLITAGVLLTKERLKGLADIGLDLALTLNAPLHRQNIHSLPRIIDYAVEIGAGRLEIAHIQYYAWALKNRAALMPTEEDFMATARIANEAKERLKGILVFDFVVPDYYAKYPKPCMGGWGRGVMNVTPSGRVLPCHAAESLPGLTFDTVKEKGLREIWLEGEAFNLYRGTEWMKEPCKSCARKEIDFGGCRCQALALTGDAKNTDPACSLSPHHADWAKVAREESHKPPPQFIYRRMGAK